VDGRKIGGEEGFSQSSAEEEVTNKIFTIPLSGKRGGDHFRGREMEKASYPLNEKSVSHLSRRRR